MPIKHDPRTGEFMPGTKIKTFKAVGRSNGKLAIREVRSRDHATATKLAWRGKSGVHVLHSLVLKTSEADRKRQTQAAIAAFNKNPGMFGK